MKKIIIKTACIICSLFVISCTSLQQDKMVSSVFAEEMGETVIIEQEICSMDCSYILEKNGFESEKKYSLNDYENLILKIDEVLSNEGLIKQSEAMLYAFKGRIYLFEDKKSRAKECFEKSSALYKGDLQTLILGTRLGIYKNPEEINSSKEYKPYLLLENGIKLFEKKDFLGTVAKIDQAYLGLSSIYKASYKKLREAAWNLKDIKAGESDKTVLYKREISIGEMLSLTQEYSNALFELTSGKTNSETELYSKVSKSKLLEPASGKNLFETKNESILNRILCARFLWNLYCYNNNIAKTEYSDEFKNDSISPVKDVQVNDADFAAVIGCVQEEFMDLEKGLYFEPEKPVSATEYKSYVQKLK